MQTQELIIDVKDDITWEYVSTGMLDGERITNEGSCGIGVINACGGDIKQWEKSVIRMLESLGIEIFVIDFKIVKN